MGEYDFKWPFGGVESNLSENVNYGKKIDIGLYSLGDPRKYGCFNTHKEVEHFSLGISKIENTFIQALFEKKEW